MGVLKEFPEHVLICARALYEETDVSSSTIAELLGIGMSTLSRRAILLGWQPRIGPRARRASMAAAASSDLTSLATRIRAHVDRQIIQAEHNLGKSGSRSARISDSERSARTLASLTRTLNELKRLEAVGPEGAARAEDEAVDLDDFRRKIARRLDELCGESEEAESTCTPDEE